MVLSSVTAFIKREVEATHRFGKCFQYKKQCFICSTSRVTVKRSDQPIQCILKMMETDFIEPKSSKNLSYDDKKFLTTLDEGIHVTNDNHYEMPLPFKISNPVVPNSITTSSQNIGAFEEASGRRSEFIIESTLHS